jgi:hypothetical protein
MQQPETVAWEEEALNQEDKLSLEFSKFEIIHITRYPTSLFWSMDNFQWGFGEEGT